MAEVDRCDLKEVRSTVTSTTLAQSERQQKKGKTGTRRNRTDWDFRGKRENAVESVVFH